jgi:hypothetical protein
MDAFSELEMAANRSCTRCARRVDVRPPTLARHAMVAALLLFAATVVAQENDKPLAPAGRISGTVVTDAGAPLAGATIVMAGLPDYETLTAVSDAVGAFDLPRVPAGSYQLTAIKTGYFFKGRGANAAAGAHPVTVRDGQAVRSVTLAMTRGGAVVGRIVDEFGDPVDQVLVHAVQYSYQPDGRRLAHAAGVSDVTDDRGEFRVYGLPPGDFIVAATSPSLDPEPHRTGLFNTAAPVERAPTYFPGTLDIAQAQTLSLRAGQEASVQFALLPGRTFRISGTGVTSTGAPGRLMRITLSNATSSRRAEPVAPDGRFTLQGVPPGNYSLQIVNLGPSGSEEGSTRVTVDDDDVTGVVLTTTPRSRIRGQVVSEGQPLGRGVLGPAAKDALLLRMIPKERTDVVSQFWSGVNMQQDGQFEMMAASGRMFFDVGGNWMITSVTLDGVDVLDEGIDVGGTDVVSGVRITVTDRQTSVSGRVTTDRGEPLEGCNVVLFRLDGVPAQVALGIRALRTDAEGRFETRGLRSGSYVAAAIEDLEPGSHFTSDVQERLRVVGYRFSLRDEEAVTLDLEPVSNLP